jgi:hypothetical protein
MTGLTIAERRTEAYVIVEVEKVEAKVRNFDNVIQF